MTPFESSAFTDRDESQQRPLQPVERVERFATASAEEVRALFHRTIINQSGRRDSVVHAGISKVNDEEVKERLSNSFNWLRDILGQLRDVALFDNSAIPHALRLLPEGNISGQQPVSDINARLAQWGVPLSIRRLSPGSDFIHARRTDFRITRHADEDARASRQALLRAVSEDSPEGKILTPLAKSYYPEPCDALDPAFDEAGKVARKFGATIAYSNGLAFLNTAPEKVTLFRCGQGAAAEPRKNPPAEHPYRNLVPFRTILGELASPEAVNGVEYKQLAKDMITILTQPPSREVEHAYCSLLAKISVTVQNGTKSLCTPVAACERLLGQLQKLKCRNEKYESIRVDLVKRFMAVTLGEEAAAARKGGPYLTIEQRNHIVQPEAILQRYTQKDPLPPRRLADVPRRFGGPTSAVYR